MAIEPPPLIASLSPGDNVNVNQWLRKIWVQLGGATGLVSWDNIDKTGSSLADLITRSHGDLQSIQGDSDSYHLSAELYTNLSSLTTISSTTTLGASHGYVLCNAAGGAFTVNLPAATTRYRFHVKKIDSSVNAVTLDAAGSDTIQGSGTVALAAQYNSRTIYSDGSGVWYIESST